MSPFVSQDAQKVRDNPTEGETVELVIGVQEGHLSQVSDWIEEHDGEVKREVPFNMLLVHLGEPSVARLCEVRGVESVEFNESIEVLDSGN